MAVEIHQMKAEPGWRPLFGSPELMPLGQGDSVTVV